MRWDSQRVDREEGRTLPGLDVERVRTFDAPEALGINFHEVRAKSALNKVPGDYLPFNYTVNAFRGCSHACQFCFARNTHTYLDLNAGRDFEREIIVKVNVPELLRAELNRPSWKRELVAFGTNTDPYQWAEGRYRLMPPMLEALRDTRTPASVLSKSPLPLRDLDLYLELAEVADVSVNFSVPTLDEKIWRQTEPHTPHPRKRIEAVAAFNEAGIPSGVLVAPLMLALADFEALRRARSYLRDLDIEAREFQFAAASGTRREIRAIRSQARVPVQAIREAVEWPRGASDLWAKGFLAGIFDAEGSYSCGVFRIANCNSEIIDWTTWSLRQLDFDYVLEPTGKANGLTYIRMRGGLREAMRFFHATDPAITRKRSIEGVALKSDSRLKVESIELIGERQLFDITTGTGDFIANGVVSHNCFARNTHTYLDLNAGRDFEREIVVKVNVPELLRAELNRPSWKRELVAFGTNTDPYQWAEGRYGLMPPMLEALKEAETPASVLTKSSLALRDLEHYTELAEVADASVNFSVPTLDEKIWRQTEPHTPHPRKRLEAVAAFNEAGIPSGVLVAPLMPGINDDPELVEEIVALAEQAGATFVNGIALHLRPGVKEVFMSWLSAARPDLVPRYEKLYDGRAYAPNAERKRIGALVRAPNGSRDARYRRRDQLEARRRRRAEAASEPESAQTTLF